MNVLHMKYALEVARSGSINKAAETLLIAQPNLSRAIKELEGSLGITIFERTTRGMTPTPEGEAFLNYAANIQKQIDEVENIYKGSFVQKQRFSVCVPRATYISEGFANFTQKIGSDPVEIFYRETNASNTIKNVLSSEYKLGIVRYASHFDKYFKSMFTDKGLEYELISEFRFMLVMSRRSPLAELDEIHFTDLEKYIEIAHADPYVPFMSMAEVRREELPDNIRRRIFVFERGSQFDLLTDNEETFMWVSPLTDKMLERYDLVEKPCADNDKLYRDVLIHRNDHNLSKLEKLFITEVCMSKRKYL
ncbi:DNA-binding transcriptional regulator, LysR family [Ruminococcus sp. YE71]|uniref:LysR family transcriptional regulator n=1 Tax=unclassified Ruminococcus TaxID=2608920 RepID=UPI00088AD187|nr:MULTISPECIES: LysR family transcriptional regulator [unclassified Ruminococcus]SDA22766.1 DNA-binding transcriptional regulator, LysR family [Ruminococcus sp. YE78]SFW38762.1 DNA-binding transcriptional regulator, LysR family [Ruminococcus sp. YE71]